MDIYSGPDAEAAECGARRTMRGLRRHAHVVILTLHIRSLWLRASVQTARNIQLKYIGGEQHSALIV